MNKVILILVSIIIIIASIITAVVIYKGEDEEQAKVSIKNIEENTTNTLNNTINSDNQNVIETNVKEVRISPNAFITFKEIYEGCGHTKVDFVEVPQDFVNLSEDELKDKYSDWNIEKFTDTDIILSKDFEGSCIILSKDFEGSCDEHFIVKDVNGVVTVFKIKEDGTEEEYQTTDIATEYLTDTDKIEMEKGIRVNGKQNLNQLIEDYE